MVGLLSESETAFEAFVAQIPNDQARTLSRKYGLVSISSVEMTDEERVSFLWRRFEMQAEQVAWFLAVRAGMTVIEAMRLSLDLRSRAAGNGGMED